MVAAEEITVFHAVPTRSCRVVWLMEELGLKYKTIPVDFPKELFTEEFLKVNPMGTCVPAICPITHEHRIGSNMKAARR